VATILLVGVDLFFRGKLDVLLGASHRLTTADSIDPPDLVICDLARVQADEVADIELNSADLKIDTYRASGAGGQHVNKTDSAVRVTHLPTGIVVECQDDRSQHKNKARALSLLAARIKDQQLREQQTKEAATRKSLVGSGDRSDRVRTYNFPQGRVTDHRIKLDLYKIGAIMDGDLDDIIDALAAEHQAEQLAALAEVPA